MDTSRSSSTTCSAHYVDIRPTLSLKQAFQTMSHSKTEGMKRSAISKFAKDRKDGLISRNALTPRCVGYIDPSTAKRENHAHIEAANIAMRTLRRKKKKPSSTTSTV